MAHQRIHREGEVPAGLAHLAAELRSPTPARAPLQALLEAIELAQHSVQFVSVALDMDFIAPLSAAATRVPVQGVVANATPALTEQVAAVARWQPQFDLRCLATPTTWRGAAQERLVLIDGVLALHGRVGFTRRTWDEHARHYRAGIGVACGRKEVAPYQRAFRKTWTAQAGVAPGSLRGGEATARGVDGARVALAF